MLLGFRTRLEDVLGSNDIGNILYFEMLCHILSVHRGSEHHEVGLSSLIIIEILEGLRIAMSHALLAGVQGFHNLGQRLVLVKGVVPRVHYAQHLVGLGHSRLQHHHALARSTAVIQFVGNAFLCTGVLIEGTGHISVTPGYEGAVAVEEEVHSVNLALIRLSILIAWYSGSRFGAGRSADGEAHVAGIPIGILLFLKSALFTVAGKRNGKGKGCEK